MTEWWKQQIKGIPKSEEVCTRIGDAEHPLIYVLTKDKSSNYKLYSVDNYKATYTKHKSNNPLKLEKFMQSGVSLE